MSLIYLIFGWLSLTSLGIGAIVAAEPLWTREQPVRCGEEHTRARR
jgi:hypothetical protein